MGEAHRDKDVPFLGQELRAAAVICRTEYGNLHSGVLYRDGDKAGFVHLGMQDQLSNSWSWDVVWAAPQAEPERLLSVAGLCRLIWVRYSETKKFPYAIRFVGTTFDAASGQLRLGEGAKGLTCATFILAVFSSVGVQLVDEATWPPRPEADRAFLKLLEEFTTPEHLKILQEEVDSGARRIWPDEVVGACNVPLPAGFEDSRKQGDGVLAVLQAAADEKAPKK